MTSDDSKSKFTCLLSLFIRSAFVRVGGFQPFFGEVGGVYEVLTAVLVMVARQIDSSEVSAAAGHFEDFGQEGYIESAVMERIVR